MLKVIDWQMIAFVGGSLLQEYLRFPHVPRMYYFQEDKRRR
ncbi:hypothetical protein N0O92_22720 [Alkalihalobacillus sp. MEB130]|nr:hypothetical protein [Alkalihalobacillus sp. MEB130]MDT8862985.1 hypothetical protein [Alkalihalobacillus sp. MEB130]